MAPWRRGNTADGHPRLGDLVHRSRHERYRQLDVTCEGRRGVDGIGQGLGPPGDDDDVVERECLEPVAEVGVVADEVDRSLVDDDAEGQPAAAADWSGRLPVARAAFGGAGARELDEAAGIVEPGGVAQQADRRIWGIMAMLSSRVRVMGRSETRTRWAARGMGGPATALA